MDKDKWLSIWKQPVKYSNAELAVPSSDICILIDNSLSMNKKKLEEIKAAAIEFISTLKEEDKIAVVSFDAKKTADACYNKDPNQKIAHKLKLNGYKTNARLNALGGYPMSLPNASKFINHFIENTGKLREYDAKELLETDNAKKYYQKNMNALLKACEEMTMDKDTIFIISTREMKKAKKFFACDFSSVGSKSTEEKDWWFSVGNADVGMVAKCTRNGKQYNIELRYIVQDMYDWEEGSVAVGGLVTDVCPALCRSGKRV